MNDPFTWFILGIFTGGLTVLLVFVLHMIREQDDD